MKQDSLDRSHSELKKLRRKSQGKNANKYELKENEVRGTPALRADVTPQRHSVAWHARAKQVLAHLHCWLWKSWQALRPSWRSSRCWSALREASGGCTHPSQEVFLYGLLLTPHQTPRTPDLVWETCFIYCASFQRKRLPCSELIQLTAPIAPLSEESVNEK